MFGKFIFLTLFVLSIWSWSLLLYKVWSTRKGQRLGALVRQQFEQEKNNPLNIPLEETTNSFFNLYKTLRMGALEILQKNRSYTGSPPDAPIYLSSSDVELLESHLETNIGREIKSLEKNLFVLSTVVSLAPFLGLLGTVWGILITFAELQAGASAAASDAVMGGLSMALGTTVLGLLVAIPALVGQNYIKALIREFSTELRDFAYTALAAVELQYRKVDVA